MKRICNLAAAALMVELCSTCPLHALPLPWRADWPDAKPVETLVHRGTDVELQPTWFINKTAADTNGWTFTTFCQTNAVGPWFGPLPGAFFSHTNDVGAAFYNVMVRAQMPGGAVNYTAFARLRMLDSPGFVPGVLPLPAKSINFADVEVFNAPYYTKAETEAKIVELAPVPGDYATVSNRAMSAVQTETDPVWNREKGDYATVQALENGDIIVSQANAADHAVYAGQASFATDANFAETANSAGYANNAGYAGYAETAAAAETGSELDTRLTSLSSRVSAASIASTNYTDAAISTIDATKADRSELAGYATPADVYRIVAGTNVILVITNYNSAVHAPSMKLQHLDPETGEYVTYWDEARGHGITLTNAMDYADGVAARLDAAKAPRAWSRVTSGLGADAPEGTTFISTPVTHISGGFEFEKKITAGGTVWTLCSTSLAAGSTTNGFFEISALDGTPVFSVEKTDSVLVGVNASAIAVVDNACVISVPAVADTHPFARVATTLVQPTWYKETEDGMPAQSPATVSWSGQSGAWVATVDFGASPQGFVFFEYLQEGGVKIVNSAVVDLSQGVHYGGATYMPTVSGNELKFIRQ